MKVTLSEHITINCLVANRFWIGRTKTNSCFRNELVLCQIFFIVFCQSIQCVTILFRKRKEQVHNSQFERTISVDLCLELIYSAEYSILCCESHWSIYIFVLANVQRWNNKFKMNGTILFITKNTIRHNRYTNILNGLLSEHLWFFLFLM